MSALQIYRRVFQTRYADDAEHPNRPVAIGEPRDSGLGGVWAGPRPAAWITFNGFGLFRSAPLPSDTQFLAETLTLNMVAMCNANDIDGTEESLVDRMRADAAWLQGEIPIGIESVTVVRCLIWRTAVGQAKTPAVQAALTFEPVATATDADFARLSSGIADDFQPTMVAFHELPGDVITRVEL